jgi:uncharacterized protein (TIGR00725 family)
MTILIGVCGSGKFPLSQVNNLYKKVETIGKEIAKNKGVLICGGMKGIMEVACKGAKKEGGITIGILPYNKSEKNEYVDIPIVTGIGEKRNSIIVQSADCIIAIAGQWGTLNEIILANLYQKPIVFLQDSSGFVDMFLSSDFLKQIPSNYIQVSDPIEAVKNAFILAKDTHTKD